ncbi:MAG TPA: carboxypeptidase regulatory-like domain-containing protein [Anaeromyxobacter sp.]|nr:carboxypeptidase regulatory-like domain-containing protein [Anaeromyxobacter sp.]
MNRFILSAVSAGLFLLTGCSGCDDPEPTPTPTSTISGTVTRAWGGALAGVTVTLGGHHTASAVTGADGRYAFPGLMDGAYTVTPALAGYAFTPAAPTVTVSGADVTRDFSADGAYTVSGTVTTAWATPLPGASVALSGGDVTKPAVTTDAAGHYEFVVPNGTFTLTATLAGYVITPSAPSVTVSGAGETHDFSADGAFTVSGTVTTAWGASLAGVSVSLSGDGVTRGPVVTDAAGHYELAVPNGTYTLTAARSGYAISPGAPSVTVSGVSATRDFTADGAYTISGTITTLWATALQGASVVLSGGGITLGPVATDAAGHYEFNVPDGTFTVTPTLAGYAFTPAAPSVEVSGASATQSFSADGAYTVSGTVTTAWGTPLQGTSVSLSGGAVTRGPVQTDAAGRYELTVPNGTFTVTPTLSGYVFDPPAPTVEVNGAAATRSFTADGAYTISGTVTTAWATPLQGASVALGGGGVTKPPVLTDAAGRYAFNVPDGTFVVTPTLASYAFTPAASSVEVSGASATRNFTADGAYTISGTVTTAWGTPLEGASIALGGGGVTKPPVVTDAAGHYELAVPDGTFTVTPTLASYVFTPSAATVEVSGASKTQDLSADGAYTISGTITGPVVAGVSIALAGGGVVKPAAVSTDTGAYAFAGIPNGTYTLTPTFGAVAFQPPSAVVAVSDASALQDFTSLSGAVGIAGTVRDAMGVPLAGMTVRLSGASAAIETTDAAGAYTFGGLAPGQSYTVTHATFGYSSSPPDRTYAALSADVVDADFQALPYGPTPAIEYRGTVSYAGTRTGPVYVAISSPNGGWTVGGTGLAAADGPFAGRPFAVRNIQGGTPIKVRAWMDTLGVGRFNAGADPSVTISASATGSPWNLGDLELLDPPYPPAVASPVAVNATIAMDGAAVVIMDAPRNQNGEPVADGHVLYWNDAPTVDETHNLGSLLVPAGPDFGIVRGLTNGTAYWFRVVAYLRGAPIAGQSVATATGLTVGPPTGTATVSGLATHPAVASPSALYVVAQGGKGADGGVSVHRIPNPTGTQTSYSFNVAPGTYQVFGFVDMGDDGVVNVGEPAFFPSDKTPLVTFVDGQNAGPTVAIPAGAAFASLKTSRWANSWGPWTYLVAGVGSGTKLPLSAVLTGPGLRGPADLGINLDGGSGIDLGLSFQTDPILPFVGDTYTLAVTYTDGSTETFLRDVTGVFSSPPVVVSPQDGAMGVDPVPTFAWSAPAPEPASYGYHLRIFPDGGGDPIWETFLPSSQRSVRYNADGMARQPQLAAYTRYRWEIATIDAFGNDGAYMAWFTTGAAALPSFDPLDGTTLDGVRWQTPQFTRSVSGGKARLWVRADAMQAFTVQGMTYTNSIPIIVGLGSRVTKLRAKVTVPSADALRTGTAVAQGGIRLVYQPVANRGLPIPFGFQNVLTAGVELYDSGSGLMVRRRFLHCNDASCASFGATGFTAVDPAGFTASADGVEAAAPAAYGTEYELELSVDEAGEISWSVSGGVYATPVGGAVNVAGWAAAVGMTLQNGFLGGQLMVRATDPVGGSSAALTTVFDDVFVGQNGNPATLFDDFDTMGSVTTFNHLRWGAADADAWIDGGLHIASALTTVTTGSVGQGTAVNAMYPTALAAWQADVAIVADAPAMVPGSSTSFGMVGAFYNDGTPGGGPNSALGDVRVRVTLQTAAASYTISRCTSANCNSTAFLTGGSLSLTRPTTLGTVHTLGVHWNAAGGAFTFVVDEAPPVAVPAPAPVSSPAPSYPFHGFTTGLNIGSTATPGTSSSVEAVVTNVRGSPP